MSDFHSSDDVKQFIQITKVINPITMSAYGPPLDAWGFMASVSPVLGNRQRDGSDPEADQSVDGRGLWSDAGILGRSSF